MLTKARSNQFSKMARLQKLFEPKLKKASQNPVRNRREILVQAARGFTVRNFLLLFPL